MANAAAWQLVAEAIATERPILILNRRGRTPSPAIADGYSVDTEIDDLQLWLTTFDTPVDLVGHSYGGLIALETVRRGTDVNSLVLYEPVARPFGNEVLPALDVTISAGDLDYAAQLINVDLSGYSLAHVDHLRSTPVWPTLMQLAHPAGPELHSIDLYDVQPLANWTTPTTIIAGELSRHRAPYGPSTDFYLALLGNPPLTILENEDHIAHVTAPVELASAIRDALR